MVSVGGGVLLTKPKHSVMLTDLEPNINWNAKHLI